MDAMDSCEKTGCEAPTRFKYSATLRRLNWLGLPTIFSILILAHFTFSVGLWCALWAGDWLNPHYSEQVYQNIADDLPCAGPAFCLFALSLVCLRGALLRKRFIWRWLVLLACTAFAVFAIDVRFQRYQVSVDIASQQYWDRGRPEHIYFTWWWYNDRWFRG